MAMQLTHNSDTLVILISICVIEAIHLDGICMYADHDNWESFYQAHFHSTLNLYGKLQ